jgi:2-C-methyl-D-erythritol 4-phosphate cytidylyltransferase
MTTEPELLYALVPAAGSGERAGGGKLYRRLAGGTVIAHTLAALAGVHRIRNTLVVLAREDAEFSAHAPAFAGWREACGGATRAASVRAGLAALQRRGAHSHDWVLVHDAARCLVLPAAIDRLIDHCLGDEVGGLLALPLADTLKDADAQGRVRETVNRSGKWIAQTPQMFRIGLLAEALEHAGDAVTDESSAVEALGYAPRLVAGDADNFKLTWPEDFARAERVLAARMAT